MLSRRRERAERQQQQQQQDLWLENDESDNEQQRHSQRRNLGFMRYAEENRRSSHSMASTREHARQLAMALSKEEQPFAADFQKAFASDPFAKFPDEPTESSTHTDNFDFFDHDAFASVGNSHHNNSNQNVVRRSAVHASPVTKKAPTKRQLATPEKPKKNTEAQVSSSAAARRRMRMNMRQKDQTSTPQRAEYQTPQQTATPQRAAPLQQRSTPQTIQSQRTVTPQKVQRAHSELRPQKSTPQKNATPQKQFSPSSHQRSSRNAASEESNTDHLFDIQKTSGFSFDAFGLDGAEMKRNVDMAMEELFEDEEFAPQHWSSSDEEVIVPEKISERSSLTDSANGNINMFKEQPGYHKPRKVVRAFDFFDTEGKASVKTESTSATTVTDVGKLRSRWENTGQSLPQPPKVQARQKLKPADIHRLQDQLGSEILSPEKLAAQPEISVEEKPQSSKSDGGGIQRPSGVKGILTNFEQPAKPRSDVAGSPLARRRARQQQQQPSLESQAMRLVQTHSPMSEASNSPRNDVRAQVKRRVSENRKRVSPVSTPQTKTPEFSNVQLRPVAKSATRPFDPPATTHRQSPTNTARSAVSESSPPQRRPVPDQRSYASSPPVKHDIRAQIKQRVAAAKKFEPPGHMPESSSSSDDIADARSNLRSVKNHSSPPQPHRSSERTSFGNQNSATGERFDPFNSFTEPQRPISPQGHRDIRQPQTSPPQPVHEERDPELTMATDSEESDSDLMKTVANAKIAASAAISRSIMMKQIQQPQIRQEEERKEAFSDSKPKRIAVDTGSDVVTDVTDENHMKTPKATKMMLNAFLAGRESLAAGEGAHSAQVTDGLAKATEPLASNVPPALKDDPQYERYFKMLKIGMPMDVVKHAMIRDGVDASVMDGDHNKPVGIPLKDDPEYTKYFKMFSIGLPMDAIKHSMARDGLDPSVMDQDHSLPVRKSKDHVEQPKEQDSHRRARLHWKTLRKVTSNSLWAQIDKETNFDIEIDEDEFQELFQAEKTVPSRQEGSRSTTNKRNSSVCVIDAKRANNGGIILARLKMSHDDMADAVDRIDEGAMTAEQIEQIIEYLPTKEERKALESYMLEGGQDAAEKFDALCECEKFMVSMMTVKHAKRKVSAILFKLQFETCIRDIQKEAHLIESACGELRDSSRLRQLFGIILTFGNRLNTAGNGKRKAGAFTLDSLLKLRQAKAFDKKTTFLHYIIKIVRKNNENLLDFKEDIPTVFDADKIFWDQCIADLEQVENQLENVRKIALYQAHQSNAYRLRRRTKKDDPDESLTDDDIEMSLEEELETLRATNIGMFTLSAIKYVSALRENVESTKKMFAKLLEYFGEEESAIQPHELFSTMVSFSRDFDKAKDEVVERERKQLREERQQERKRTPVKTPPKTQSPQKTMLRASNMLPNMGSVLKQLKTSALPLRRTISDGVGDQQLRAPARQHSDRHSDTSISHPPPVSQNSQLSQNIRHQSPVLRQDTRSAPQSTPKSPRSPHSTSITMSAMRAKTRIRRHRTPSTQDETSSFAPPASPTAANVSRRNRFSPAAPAYDSGAEQPVSPRSPRNNNGISAQHRDEQLSPRSSSALRMKRRMQHRVRMRNTSAN